MGHDIHFLRRLERLATPHVDTAMALYRDRELLQAVLDLSPLPADAERVAISLADPISGPFVLVERSGQFVTCLGEGMRVDELPTIPRERLDHVIEKVGRLRDRYEAALKLTGGKNVAGKLMSRLAGAGPFLSREEFVAISAMQPLMQRITDQTLSWALSELEYYRQRARRPSQISHLDEGTLRSYWCLQGLIGHLSLLFAMDGREFIKRAGLDLNHVLGKMVFGPLAQGSLGMSLRGIWAGAKLGKLVLPLLKQTYTQATLPGKSEASPGVVIFSGAVLLAIAGRSSQSRAEIGKLLERGFPHLPEPQRQIAEGIAARQRQVFLDVITDDDHQGRFANLIGQAFQFCTSDQKADSPLRYATALHVPKDLGIAAVAHSQETVKTTEGVERLFVAAAGIARVEPQELYFPEAILKLLSSKWQPTNSRELLAVHTAGQRIPAPIRATPRPGRNDPCPCGSEQKYKRCCGRD